MGLEMQIRVVGTRGEDLGRVSVRREGAEEECDGSGLEGRVAWRRRILHK